MISNYSYDKASPQSIENHAKKLEGKTFRNVLLESSFNNFSIQDTPTYYIDKKAKGSLGHLIEKYYFNYDINSNSEADFIEAGVELKTTPYKINKNKSKSAKERLVLTMINYMENTNENFENSHLLSKCKLMLLIYYLYEKEKNKLDFSIDYVNLFEIPEKDLIIIKEDYNKIINKIKAGKAHELSEGDTFYLGACTKGKNANSLRNQPYSKIKAKQRAFCLKTSYMTYILNNYIIPGKAKNKIESIDFNNNFENSIQKKIKNNLNSSVKELLNKFQIDYNEKRPKNLESNLIFKILGLKSNKASEFIKAGIKIKTIRLEYNETLKEHISLPPFKFLTLANEEWENAEINDYLSKTKFLFIIYKKDEHYDYYKKQKDYDNMDKHIFLHSCKFWNMPLNDIDNEVYSVWKKTKQIINNGITTKKVKSKTFNNLPSSKENRICHIRPHGKNKFDTLPLPDGTEFTKQCFFLNSTYILKHLLSNNL